MKFSIVLSTQQARFNAVAFKGDLEANMAKIAGWGYDGVELAIRDPRLIDVEQIAASVQKYGLAVPALGTGQAWGEEGLSFTDPDPAVRQAAIERVLSHIPVAAHFDAVIIIGLLRGIVKPEVSQQQAMRWMIDALQTCCAAAAPHGVRLALEPINRYETTLINSVADGLALVEQVGAENFGLLLDTFHMNIEDASLTGAIRAAGERIFHFHVADSNRWYPGAGHIDFRAVLETLENTGYQGFVSGEFMPLPDADSAAQEAIRYLRSLTIKTSAEKS